MGYFNSSMKVFFPQQINEPMSEPSIYVSRVLDYSTFDPRRTNELQIDANAFINFSFKWTQTSLHKCVHIYSYYIELKFVLMKDMTLRVYWFQRDIKTLMKTHTFMYEFNWLGKWDIDWISRMKKKDMWAKKTMFIWTTNFWIVFRGKHAVLWSFRY